VVDAQLTVVAAHAVAVEAEHRLIHEVSRLTAAIVHADPEPHEGTDHHADLADHRPA
jgi:divalent metal cation (Fe/Co/Zn/Cd) transporter